MSSFSNAFTNSFFVFLRVACDLAVRFANRKLIVNKPLEVIICSPPTQWSREIHVGSYLFHVCEVLTQRMAEILPSTSYLRSANCFKLIVHLLSKDGW